MTAEEFAVAKFLRFRNWFKYQDPDTEKMTVEIHARILEDEKFLSLPDPTRSHFLLLLALAKKLSNRLPNDRVTLEEKIQATHHIDLERLALLEILEAHSPEALERDRQRFFASNVERKEFVERVQTYWNNVVKKPKVRKISPRLASLVWKRNTESGDEAVKTVVQYRAASYFLSKIYAEGNGASMERVFAPELFAKTLSGNYNDWNVEDLRDRPAMYKSCTARGLDEERVTLADSRIYLRADCFRANLAAVRRGEDISYLEPYEMIEWYIKAFGCHPGTKGIK